MENKVFQTQSLNVTAWLISKGFNVIETKKIVSDSDDSIDVSFNLSFCFDRSDELIKSVDEYNRNGELKRFIGAFKDVKRMVVEGKKNVNK